MLASANGGGGSPMAAYKYPYRVPVPGDDGQVRPPTLAAAAAGSDPVYSVADPVPRANTLVAAPSYINEGLPPDAGGPGGYFREPAPDVSPLIAALVQHAHVGGITPGLPNGPGFGNPFGQHSHPAPGPGPHPPRHGFPMPHPVGPPDYPGGPAKQPPHHAPPSPLLTALALAAAARQ